MDTGVILRILLLVALVILLFIPTLWAIRDVAYRSFPTRKAKAIWLAVVTLLPPLGGLIYVFMGRHRIGTQADEPKEEETTGP